MSTWKRLRIYGSDIDYSSDKYSVPKSTLDTAGVVYFDLDVLVVNGKPVREVEIVEYFGSKKQLVTQGFSLNPESMPMAYSAATNAHNFWGMNVTNKTYNYVWFDTAYGTYNLLPSGFDSSTNCLMLNITGLEYNDDAENSSKGMTLILESLI
jgi:hypothetical protein